MRNEYEVSPGACVPDSPERKMTPIESAMSRVGTGLVDLERLVGILEEKVSPFLSKEVAEGTNQREIEEIGSGSSDVYMSIEQTVVRITGIADHVRRIRDRVEL